MLGFATKKTRGQLLRDELGASWEHLLQAATHAANGVGSSVGPSASKVRSLAAHSWDSTSAALTPLAVAYRQGAADAQAAALKLAKKTKSAKGKQHMGNKRVGVLLGLLAAGAALGAAGALVMRRRRRQQQWSDYDVPETLDSVSGDARSVLEKAGSKVDKAMDATADKLESTASAMRRSDFKSKAENSADVVQDAADKLEAKFSASKHNARP